MTNWKEIWSSRKSIQGNTSLSMLINMDGFDSGAGNFSEKIWREYVLSFCKKNSIQNTDTIFEVGCGSGAFLYPLYLESCIVGGLDYSASLLDVAARVMPKGKFSLIEASHLNIEEQFDIVFSHSVFQYFETLDYAKKVLEKMILKSKYKVIILDAPDKLMQEEAYRIRRGALTASEYDQKYTGLNHLFYEKKWFEKIAIDNNCRIEFYTQCISGYLNSEFRFNVVINKK